MRQKWTLLLVFAALFLGCKDPKSPPKVIYETAGNGTKTERKASGDKVTFVDLPVQFEGTDVLLFPVGDVVMNEERMGKMESMSTAATTNYAVANTSEFEIAGNMTNLKFQTRFSDSLVALTDRALHIGRVSYLHGVALGIKKQLLVYEVEDADTNQDGQINANDIHSLYLSTLEGTAFQKISPDLQEVIDWNVIESRKHLYFRAIEDRNKNGAFDKDDTVHYYVVDLGQKEFQAQEYFPLK